MDVLTIAIGIAPLALALIGIIFAPTIIAGFIR